jgi:hypothetical protein
MKEQPMSDEKPMGQVIQIDEARLTQHGIRQLILRVRPTN